MPSLSELQRGFAAATVFGDSTALASLGVRDHRLGAAERMAIYRNNVFANYRKALSATYPVVQALVGRAFFGAAVEIFVRAHPSTRGDVNRYGGALARFLASYPPAHGLPYLPDVARLEWAIDQAAIAAEAGALDLESLAAVAESALGSLRFDLHPSARFVVSPYPIFRIWQANQPGHESDEPVDLGEGRDRLLVVRGVDGVWIDRLTPGAYAFLVALGRNLALSDAVERAATADAAFDLGDALRRYIAARAIVAFHTPSIPSSQERA